MTASIRRSLQVVAVLAGALGVAVCADGPTGLTGAKLRRASFAFAPQWQSSAHGALLALADEGLGLDRVRVLIVLPVSDTLKDTTITMHEGDPSVTLQLDVAAPANQSLDADMQFKSGETVLFEGTAVVTSQPISAPSGSTTPVSVTVSYVGPGAAATKVAVTPATGIYTTNAPIQFTATATDDNGTPFPNTPFAWTVADATFGTITSAGLFTPTGKRGDAIVTATTPKGLTGSATASIAPAPASIVVVSGDNQSAAATQQVAQPLVVAVLGADGTGVPGQTVTFAATDGGTVVTATATTAANGQAQTALKVGAKVGAYNFTATSGSFVVGAKSTATLGAAAKMVQVGPSAFTLTAGLAPTGASSVRVTDAGDNPVPNVSVQLDVTGASGTGTLTLTSDANGLVTLPSSFATGAKVGTYTATFSNPTLAGGPLVFTITVIAGAPSKLVLTTLPQAVVTSGVVWSPQPVVLLEDVASNAVAQSGVVVTVALSAGSGTLSGTLTATTDATGRASFTSLSLTGLVGGRTLNFTSGALVAVTAPVSIASGTPTQMTIVAGDGQSVAAGTAVGVAPSVKVVDVGGNPIAGIPIVFSVVSGGGSVNGGTTNTDATGTATVTSWTLGTTAGSNSLVAVISSSVGTGVTGNPATFTATGTPGLAARLDIKTAPPVTVQSGIPFTTQPIVQVVDANDNAVAQSNIQITASVATNAELGGTKAMTTNGSGFVSFLNLVISGTVGSRVITFSATPAGLTSATAAVLVQAGTPAVVTLSGSGQTASAGAQVPIAPVAHVTDGAGNPVAGVSVVFTTAAGSGTPSPSTVMTDATGSAALTSWTLGAVGTNTLTAKLASNPADNFSITATATAVAHNRLALVISLPPIVRDRLPVTSSVAVQLHDGTDQPVNQAGVTVILAASGGAAIVAGDSVATTDSHGIATFSPFVIAGTQGTIRLEFRAAGFDALTGSTQFVGGLPARIISTSGNNQDAIVANRVPNSPQVEVVDIDGNGVSGVPIAFSISGGGGSVPNPQVTTNSNGYASTPWTLGNFVGLNVLTATAKASADSGSIVGFVTSGSSGTVLTSTLAGNPVNFDATAVAGPAARMIVTTPETDLGSTRPGDNIPVNVLVTDSLGNPTSGDTIVFTVTGGGTIDHDTLFTAGGYSAVFEDWGLSESPGLNTLTVSAVGTTAAGIVPALVTLSTTTLVTSRAPGTPRKIPAPIKPPPAMSQIRKPPGT